MQARAKGAIKPMLVADEELLRTVRFGPGRGVRAYLNRRHDLQREFGLYESELSALYRRLIDPDSIVYDVGANDGLTALMFAKLAARGHVYAFEPEAHSLSALERNLAANPMLAPRVTVVPAAAGHSSANTSIDAFAEREPPPMFVKIDVDGAELDVLEGMRSTLRTHFPALVVETHSRELEERCVALLDEAEYRVTVRRNAWWRVLYPEMRPIEHNRWLVAERR
jgi:precorrin-6B methylase 2